MRTRLTILLILFTTWGITAPKVTIVKSTTETLQLHVFINQFFADALKPIHLLVGLPNERLPELNIQMLNKQNINGFTEPVDAASVEWIQQQNLRGLSVATLKITPGNDGNSVNQFFTEILISMNFDKVGIQQISAKFDDILASKVINWNAAQNWRTPTKRSAQKVKSIPSGQWLKFEIEKDGIYQISGTDLIDIMPTIDQYDTRSFSLFTGSNLGRSQSQVPGAPIPSNNFTEIPFQYDGSNDGHFAENDAITFYAQGASGFDLKGINISFNQNIYFDKNIYWLFIPDDQSLRGKRVTDYVNNETPTINLEYGIFFQHIENDIVNPFESGLGWAEHSISTNSTSEKSVTIIDPVSDVTPNLRLGFFGGTTDNKIRSVPTNIINVRLNSLQTSTLQPINWSGIGQRTSTLVLPTNQITDGTNTIFLTNNSNDGYSQPYFDFLTLFYGRQLNFSGDAIEFYTPIHSNPINFRITASSEPIVWKITDVSDPLRISTSLSGNSYNFIITPDVNSLDKIIIFNNDNIQNVSNIEYVGRRNLNFLRNNSTQADHIIIAPNEYANSVNKLNAHRSNSIFASLEDIYDEFAGGNSDPMAIRNFIDWTQNNWQTPLKYVFIIGDADYDYRNITGNSNNIVPTIEVGITRSYATDDRLATINGSIPEVALGRFPARTVTEADDYINKLIELETNPEFGLWRQRVTLIADDAARPEDTIGALNIGKSHTINSEILANIIPPAIEINKLYMMEFPEESDASSFGVAKPAATSALFDILETGTAIVNYIGHGSAHQWAQERLLFQDRGDLQTIDTGMKLPLWIAGTCSWGHFDDIGRESFSEELIRQPMNGASAIITTSRPITVTSNQYYEEQLFRSIFPNRVVSDQPIGIILQSIKTGNQEGEYFHLFGDPAMRLPLPYYNLDITNVSPDTLKTLGETAYTAAQDITQSGGEGFVILKDAEREVTREYNYLSNIESLSYKLPGPTLFRGKFDFDSNIIDGKLRVPKDISFSDSPASLKMYIKSNDSQPIEALGWQDSLFIISGDATNDKFGPIISFETNEKRILRTGDHFNENEDIFIRLTDPLGINLTGEIGHNIELTDLSIDEQKVITDDFIYDNNSITTGTIPLQYDDNTDGLYLSLKAWDSANNPAENTIKLNRIAEAKLKLFNVTNFPNPFAKSTQFTFELTQPADVGIVIYTLGGRKILEIEPNLYATGYHVIDWDGKDAFGDKLANGVYLYRLKAVGEEETASFIGRLAKYE